MKNFFLAILCFSFKNSFAQIIFPVNDNNQIEYTEVIKVDSLSADALFSKAKISIVSTFKSAKDVTQLVDEFSHTIIAKGYIPVSIKSGGFTLKMNVAFKYEIQTKDFRYKYSMTDFVVIYKAGTATPENRYSLEEDKPRAFSKKQWADIRTEVHKIASILILLLKEEMAVTKKDEW